jgi:hypothetical protein
VTGLIGVTGPIGELSVRIGEMRVGIGETVVRTGDIRVTGERIDGSGEIGERIDGSGEIGERIDGSGERSDGIGEIGVRIEGKGDSGGNGEMLLMLGSPYVFAPKKIARVCRCAVCVVNLLVGFSPRRQYLLSRGFYEHCSDKCNTSQGAASSAPANSLFELERGRKARGFASPSRPRVSLSSTVL